VEFSFFSHFNSRFSRLEQTGLVQENSTFLELNNGKWLGGDRGAQEICYVGAKRSNK
jgi:uncharacterized protein YchJ